MVHQPAFGQQDYVVELVEHAGRRLVNGADDDFTRSRDTFQRVDDVRGRETVQARGDLVAEQYGRVVQELDGKGHFFPFSSGQKRQSSVQNRVHADGADDVVDAAV